MMVSLIAIIVTTTRDTYWWLMYMVLTISFCTKTITLIVVLMARNLLLCLDPMRAVVMIVLDDLRFFDLGLGAHV